MSYGTSEQLEKDFNRLNEQQREIITRFSKNSLVVAGPGTGKTRTISVLIAKQLEKGIRLKEILALILISSSLSRFTTLVRLSRASIPIPNSLLSALSLNQ